MKIIRNQLLWSAKKIYGIIQDHDYKFFDTYKNRLHGDLTLYGVSELLPCTKGFVFN